MRSPALLRVVIAGSIGLGLGGAAGWALRGADAGAHGSARGADAAVDPAARRADGTAVERSPRAREDAGAAPAAPREHGAGGTRDEARRACPDTAACEATARAATARVAILERELEAARTDRTDHEGEPIQAPAQLATRFDGPSVRSAIEAAIEEAHVEGRVEELDCSEHPCIAFGRLRGDEEDMERIERAAALAAYHADVLTLLFWAVTDESAARAHPGETGLFALAFVDRATRERLGDRVDLRIRVRAVDLWTTLRPGWDERP